MTAFRPAAGSSTATYVFAVCRGGDPGVSGPGVLAPASAPAVSAPDGAAGRAEDTGVRLLPLGSLDAVVQHVPAAEFSEEAVRRRLSERAELERCARAHHAVVSAAARRVPTVPLPLATLYHDDERARAALRDRAHEFHAVLDRIEGRVEWGVKAYVLPGPPSEPAPAPTAPAGPATIPAGSAAVPDGPAGAGAPPRPGAGRAYLDRVRGRRQAREERHDAAARAAERVDTALRGLAVAARRLRPHAPDPGGDRRTQLLNAAYLVAEERSRELVAAIGRLRREAAGEGLEIEFSGPWVPYSFVQGGDGG